MYNIKIIIPTIVIPKSNVADPTNKLITDAIIIPINAINSIEPSFVKSILVKCPNTAIIANTNDVIPNTYTIESSLKYTNRNDNVNPVKNAYRQYNIFAVIVCIFLIPADNQIHTPISTSASIQYPLAILYTILCFVDT